MYRLSISVRVGMYNMSPCCNNVMSICHGTSLYHNGAYLSIATLGFQKRYRPNVNKTIYKWPDIQNLQNTRRAVISMTDTNQHSENNYDLGAEHQKINKYTLLHSQQLF